jgi:MFS family permease
MIGFMIGGITVGQFADRFGILPPFAGGTILMGLGYIGIGIFCMATMLPLALVLRRRPLIHKPAMEAASTGNANQAIGLQAIGLPPNVAHALLTVAGLCCCVAMAMPQVHLVAYCADLGYGPARGAGMLAVMLGFGVASRLIFGWVFSRIGGLRTLLLGSVMQAIALALYLLFDGLVSLTVVSATFGLAQGGLVPSYAVIIRELFPAREAGLRVSLAISTTLAGMALGGWLAGAIHDWTGSYAAALINGIGWNIVNMAIVIWLLRQTLGRSALASR